MRAPTPLLVAAALILASGAAGTRGEQAAPDEIRSPASVGEVLFPHRLHYEDLELECATCHHETDAASLDMPHEDYFEDFWIDCRACHHPEAGPKLPQSCAGCHHSTPAGIADETLSAKVMIHKSCWECHEAGTGEDASRSCGFCHTGPRSQH